LTASFLDAVVGICIQYIDTVYYGLQCDIVYSNWAGELLARYKCS
jgi:hypothetical protein